MKKFFSDFKAFISQGNIIDMAVGVVIGTAFKAIVSSLVADIITPLIALITGNVDLKGLKYVIIPEVVEKLDPETGDVLVAAVPEVAITYGVFLQAIIDFLLIAICIFVVIRIMMGAKKKLEELTKKQEQQEEAAPAAPTTKICPFCKSEIAIDATRCAHCTSQLEE
jgi:large conductance mechanosensitive channel